MGRQFFRTEADANDAVFKIPYLGSNFPCGRAADYRTVELFFQGRTQSIEIVAGGTKENDDLHVRLADAGRQFHCRLRGIRQRSEEHTSELQSPTNLVCRLLLE